MVSIYANLELDSQWTSQGDSQGEHGTVIITPGSPTQPLRVSFKPAKRPQGENWDNDFNLHRNLGSDCRCWAYSVTAAFPTAADIAACHAFEMDFQQNQGFLVCNAGWQLLPGTGLRVWDRSHHQWNVVPGIPASVAVFTPGVLKRITVLMSHDAAQVYYHGIAVDGVCYPLAIAYPVVPQTQHPYANNAIQVDSNGQGATINFAVYECTLVGM